MLRKTLLSVMLILGTVTPSYSQMAVIDNSNLVQNIAQVARLVRQIQILTDQLNDMKTQARLGQYLGNSVTTVLLEEQAAYHTEDELLYGNDGSAAWNETFAFDETWEDGRWMEAALARDRAAWATQRSLLHLLEMRQTAFLADEHRIQALGANISGADGRNELLAAQAAIDAEMLHQQRMTQQLIMSLTNAVTVQSGYQINKDVAQQSQERYFLTNGGKTVEHPGYKDRGL